MLRTPPRRALRRVPTRSTAAWRSRRDRRWGGDSVKGLSPEAVSGSNLSPEVLEEVMRNASRDPALQEVINKQLKGRVRSELLKALAEQEKQVRLQVNGEIEEGAPGPPAAGG